MKLWTIQPVEVYEELQKTGSFTCNPEKAELTDDDMFKKAYDWLITEMEKRIGPRPEGVTYPIWAWHTREWLRKKPDLRLSCYGTRGTKCVCMEIDVPDDEVLLSDFDAWHWPLNNWYFSDCKNEEEYDLYDAQFKALPETEKEKAKKDSWNRIFNIDRIESDWMCRGRYIQATFWVLKSEYIKKVQFFTVR